MALDPLSIGTGIAQTISNITDQKKRREMEQSLALLSTTQQRQLNDKLAQTSDENEKIRILTESMTQYLIANSTQGAKKDTLLYIAAGGIAVVLLIAVIYYSKSKK